MPRVPGPFLVQEWRAAAYFLPCEKSFAGRAQGSNGQSAGLEARVTCRPVSL